MGFNSRARKGRDGKELGPVQGEGVSIHAPARGATLCHSELGVRNQVSIHAPARGATPQLQAHWHWRHSFNSRARKGRDSILPLIASSLFSFNSRARKGRDLKENPNVITVRVSIHAPARGATTAECPWTVHERFNSRARKGRDRAPRPPRAGTSSFNSRARKGRDSMNHPP